jgi:hypothetical protein
MLAQNGNGPTDFENGDKDGWPGMGKNNREKNNMVRT